MKAWLVVVCLVIGATSTEITQKAVCYLKQDAISKNAAMGYYNTIDNFDLTKAPFQLEAGTIDVFAAKDVAFPYNLITNPLTVQLPSDFKVLASATDLTDVAQLVLTIPGAAAGSLDVKIHYTDATKILSVTVTSACGAERTDDPLKTLDTSLPVADMKTWLWKFTMVDEGVDTGMQLQLKVGSDLATPVIDLAVTLDKDCRAKLDGEKGNQLATLNVATADKVKIVLGDTGPKIDGFVDNGGTPGGTPGGMTPVVDYAHLKAVVAYIATVETLSPSSVSSFVYVPNDVCYDITNYKTNAPKGTDWITVNPLGDQACPTREVDCAILTGSGDMCSFLTDYCTTCSGKCVANKYKRCAVENVIANAGVSEKVMVGATEVTASNQAEYNKLYLGEKITFSCINAEEMIPYSDQIGVLDDRTKVPLSCVINENGDVSDLDALSLTCKAKCSSFTVHSTTEIDLNLADGYPENYPLPVKCLDGYGTNTGETVGDPVSCTDGGNDDSLECYQCSLPVLEADSHAKFVSADDENHYPTSMIPTQKVYFQCDDGYSARVTGTTTIEPLRNKVEFLCVYSSGSDSVKIEELSSERTPDHYKCIKDCPIVLEGGEAPTTLKYIYGVDYTTIASVPQGKTYDVECKDASFSLQFGELDSIQCDEGTFGDKTVKECKKKCDLASFVDSEREVYAKESLADVGYATKLAETDLVLYGRPLSIKCSSDHFHEYEKTSDTSKIEFQCSDEVYNFDDANGDIGFLPDEAYDCYATCSFLNLNAADYKTEFEIVHGPSISDAGHSGTNMVQPSTTLQTLKMLPGTSVKVECNDPAATIQGFGAPEAIYKCGRNGDNFKLTPCKVTACRFPEYIDGGYRDSFHVDQNGDEYASYKCYSPFVMNPNSDLMDDANEDVIDAYKNLYNIGKCWNSAVYLPECVDYKEAEHCGLPTEIENGHVVEFKMSDGKDGFGNGDAKLPTMAKYECDGGSTMYKTINGEWGWCRKDGSMEIPSCDKDEDYMKMAVKLQSGGIKKLQRVDGTVFAGIVLGQVVDKDAKAHSEWEYGCNDGANNYAAGALCRSLGFGTGIQIPASKRMMDKKHKFGWTHVSCKYDDTLVSSHHCKKMRYEEALKEYGIKEATCFTKFDIAAVKCFDNKWEMETSVKLYRKKMACLTQFMKEDNLMNLKDMGTPKVKFMLDGDEIETSEPKYKRKGFFAKVNLVEKEYNCASCEVYVDDILLDSAKWCKADN